MRLQRIFLLQQRQKQRTADTKTRVGGRKRKNANDKNTVHVPSVQISLWAHCSENLTEFSLFLMLLLTTNVTLFYAAPLLYIIINYSNKYITFTIKESYLDTYTFHLWWRSFKWWKTIYVVLIKWLFVFVYIIVSVRIRPEVRPPKTSSGCRGWRLGYSAPLCRCSPAGAHRSGTTGAQWCSSCNQTWNQSSASLCLWAAPPQSTDDIWW